MKEYRELPEFTFQKGLRLSLAEQEQIASVIRSLRMEHSVESQELSAERLKEIGNIMEGVAAWIKNTLNLDVKSRIPPLKRITIFSVEDWPEVVKKYNISADAEGLNSDVNEVSLVDQKNEKRFKAIVFHELVHAFSRRSVHIKTREDHSGRDIEVRLFGFRNFKNNRFNWLNEIVTDMISIEIASADKEPSSQEITTNLSEYYKNGVIMLDMIFEKMSEITGRTVLDIKNELYTSYFDGDLSKLRTFKEVFGVKSLQLLSLLKHGDYPTTYLEYVATKFFELNGEEFLRRIAVLESGGEVTLSDGVAIKVNK